VADRRKSYYMWSEFYSPLGTRHSALRCAASLIIAAAMLTACGYQFRVAGQGPTIGGGAPTKPKADAPTLTIVNFENRSTEPNLETKYAAYTWQEFSTGSGTQVIAGSGPSDLVLKAQIVSVIVPTINFTLQQTLESRVTVYVKRLFLPRRSRPHRNSLSPETCSLTGCCRPGRSSKPDNSSRKTWPRGF
jgi:hypothetical protein